MGIYTITYSEVLAGQTQNKFLFFFHRQKLMHYWPTGNIECVCQIIYLHVCVRWKDWWKLLFVWFSTLPMAFKWACWIWSSTHTAYPQSLMVPLWRWSKEYFICPRMFLVLLSNSSKNRQKWRKLNFSSWCGHFWGCGVRSHPVDHYLQTCLTLSSKLLVSKERHIGFMCLPVSHG